MADTAAVCSSGVKFQGRSTMHVKAGKSWPSPASMLADLRCRAETPSQVGGRPVVAVESFHRCSMAVALGDAGQGRVAGIRAW